MIGRLVRRFRYFLNRRHMQRELADEMAAHRESMPDERRTAFGNELRLREEAREVWVWTWLDQFRQDLVYAARTFRRSPGFTLGAVTILALGVGVNLADFQIFDAMFHRISIAGADSIFRVSRTARRKQLGAVPYPAIRVYQENCTLCSYVVSESGDSEVAIGGESGLAAIFVSGNYFEALRISPAWGRVLTKRDDSPDAPAVAVLGYQYWKTGWASDPGIVGRMVHINGQIFRVVGVAPYDFDGLIGRRTAVWLPGAHRAIFVPGGPPRESFTLPDHVLFARPRPGIPLAAMEAQLTSISHSLAAWRPCISRRTSAPSACGCRGPDGI
jgi:hypothetical protein